MVMGGGLHTRSAASLSGRPISSAPIRGDFLRRTRRSNFLGTNFLGRSPAVAPDLRPGSP